MRVTLHMYDLSQGMAAQLSGQFLGEHFDGIWHTGIVLHYGSGGSEEFFYQGGVQRAPGGKTMFGVPTRSIELGETTVALEVFVDFLHGLSNRYTPDAYHLLDNNCNAFTQECAQFLLNRDIPEDVTTMPDRFRSTPLGQMLAPMIDQQMAQQREMLLSSPGMAQGMVMPGHTPILPLDGPRAREAEERVAKQQALNGAAGSGQQQQQQQQQQPAQPQALLSYSSAVLFTLGNVTQIVSKVSEALDAAPDAAGWRAQWGAALTSLCVFLEKIVQAGGALAPGSSASDADARSWLDLLFFAVGALPAAKQFMPLDLLRLLVVDRTANAVDPARVEKLLRGYVILDTEAEAAAAEKKEKPSYAVQLMATRCVANSFAASAGANVLMARESGAREHTVEFALQALLGKDARMRLAGATLGFNIATQLPKDDEDSATALTSAFLHLLQPSGEPGDAAALDEETEFTALMALGHCLKDSPAMVELAQMLDFQTARYASSASAKVKQIGAEVAALLQ